MHWKVGRINCTFKVRVRRGWADLRHFLAAVRVAGWERRRGGAGCAEQAVQAGLLGNAVH